MVANTGIRFWLNNERNREV